MNRLNNLNFFHFYYYNSSDDPLTQISQLCCRPSVNAMQKKQVLLKHALRREIRSAHEARLIRGGQPEHAYILIMTMILRYESGNTAMFPRHVT